MDHQKIFIRPYIGTDFQKIIKIWNRALPLDPITEDRFVKSILGDENFTNEGFLVAATVEENEPIGFIRAIIRTFPNDLKGLEIQDGFIPVIAVNPDFQKRGIGSKLLAAALDYFKKANRKYIWVCGMTGSAPGYIFPGVDKNAYPGGLALFRKFGFQIGKEAVSMSAEIFPNLPKLEIKITDDGIKIIGLTPELIPDFFKFLQSEFPGDWNTAARAKIKFGKLSEILVAVENGKIIGYCQWEGEHFGPFGVAKNVRNKGIGSRLFVEAIKKIHQSGGRSFWFNWAEELPQKFYSKFGMKANRTFCILKKEMETTDEPKKEIIENILPKKKYHVMIIGAHIGDAEITGGLLATKYAAEGHKVTIVHMTAGEKGNPKMDSEVYKKQRILEAQAAGKKFGVSEVIVLDHPDGELQSNEKTHLEMCDLIRAHKPDLIFTHWRGSFHRDHRNTYTIVMEGSFLAALEGIKRSHPHHLVRGLYYLENWEDLEDYKPDFWVSINDDIFQKWKEGCMEHSLLRGEVSFSYLHYYTGLAQKRGAEVGTKYAVTVSLPPISRKRKVEFLPFESEPVLIF